MFKLRVSKTSFSFAMRSFAARPGVSDSTEGPKGSLPTRLDTVSAVIEDEIERDNNEQPRALAIVLPIIGPRIATIIAIATIELEVKNLKRKGQ